MDNQIHIDDDTFFSAQPSRKFVTLSLQNNKSSVLCPQVQDITSQYLALQQLEGHERMVTRAKGIVDTSEPKSSKSYISMVDKRRKEFWKKNASTSKESGLNEIIDDLSQLSTSRTHLIASADDMSQQASSVNKGVQASVPFVSAQSNTADKISWYLEAIRRGELQSTFYSPNSKVSFQNEPRFNRRPVKVPNDFMDRHAACFVQSTKPFSPRLLPNGTTKSKVKNMRCYNPPSRRRRKRSDSSSHSSDTFESYEADETEDGESERSKSPENNAAIRDAQNERSRLPNHHKFMANSSPSTKQFERYHFDAKNPPRIINESEDNKYISFLSKVTEDILRSGIYSDRAIQQAFEFHAQFYQDEPNTDKLQSLLHQILEGLKISSEESSDYQHRKNLLLMQTSIPGTPEKETPGSSLFTNTIFKTENEFNSSENNESDYDLNPGNRSTEHNVGKVGENGLTFPEDS